jgi:hypothetical protein
MTVRTALVLIIGVVAGAFGHKAFAAMQTPQAVPDALVAAPSEYHLEFENEYVRVLRITYPPHHKAAMHTHLAPGGVIVALTDQDARVTGPDGSTRELHFKAGQARWAMATPGADRSSFSAHAEENLGDKPFELIRIDPKIRVSPTGAR